MPADVFGTPDDKTVLVVGLTGGDSVEVYDVTGKEGRRLSRPSRPARARISSARWVMGRHVLVSNRAANTISKIDYQKMGGRSDPRPVGSGRHGHLGRRQDHPVGFCAGQEIDRDHDW